MDRLLSYLKGASGALPASQAIKEAITTMSWVGMIICDTLIYFL